VSAASNGRFAAGESPFRVKGVTYRNFWDLVEERIRGGRASVLAELSDPALRAFAEQPFLSGTFYDVMPTIALCQAAATMMGVTFDEWVRLLSSYSAEKDTNGIYRMLLRLVSPGMVMERTPAAAKQYFNFVEATVEKVSASLYRTQARGVPSVLAAFYMMVTESFLRRALTLAGARNVKHQWSKPEPDGIREGLPIVVLRREMSWG
jgi:hypothetical protein